MKTSRIFKSCAVLLLAAASPGLAQVLHAEDTTRQVTDLSGSGWRLWLDKDAKWGNDELFLPPADVSKLPVNPPTGGWDALKSDAAKDVAVPGTVEEYLQKQSGPAGDIKGVSWWVRKFNIPKADTPRRVRLCFDAVRLRAEVFVNHKLVGYDLVGNTPFEVDITDAVKPGEECELAVRVTDPGGNYDWRDIDPFQWGKYTIPMSHAFGGITGNVRLVVTDPVYIDDIYVQNTPAITDVNVIVTVKNTTGKEVVRDAVAFITKNYKPGEIDNPPRKVAPRLFETALKNVKLKPGDNTLTFKASVADAKQWSLENPNLYHCSVLLAHTDVSSNILDDTAQLFGFRWFAPEDVGTNAVFRLNGKRIVLRTAISWGFWPINGIYPTPELAEKQIRTAKELGQNMLNFHRAIGQPSVLDKADELGLLYFEEPGGYVSGDATPFAQALAREKLLRMVKRDRSHPSLVIYNMINEQWDSHGAGTDPKVLAWHERDLRDAHAVDPSRTIVHTSAWAGRVKTENDPAKMNMRPFDDTVHWEGWFDYHRAGGPEVWNENLYKNPTNFYNYTTNKTEIVYDGEEGAISSPPRLEKIKTALEAAPNLGWDGGMYLDWFRQFDDFLTRKNLRAAFPTVDALTSAMGDVSLYHQGRKIENLRICDANDGYAVNGWESEIVENHSGIVDCFRNPKGDPAIMAYYNQPLYIAVKPRSQVVQVDRNVTRIEELISKIRMDLAARKYGNKKILPSQYPDFPVVDFYAVNEKDLKGPHTLRITAFDSAAKQIFVQEIPVTLVGGETYGQMLAGGIQIPAAIKSGMERIEASLVDASGKEQAHGHDDILVVDWKSAHLSGNGAVWESGGAVRNFLAKEKKFDAPAYEDKLAHLDWVVVARAPGEGEPTMIPADRFKNTDGKSDGLTATFFSGNDFKTQLHQRADKNVDLNHEAGASPDAAVPLTEFYSVRWEGQLVPPADGGYTFAIKSTGGVRLLIDGKPVIDALEKNGEQTNGGRAELAAGKPVSVLLEFKQHRDTSRCKLMWTVPETNAPDAAKLFARVRDEGTTLLVLDRADTWMDLIRKNTDIKYDGAFSIGTAWLGGLFFVREHPLFKDLPVNCAMNWPYQSVVKDGKNRLGLRLEGGELVAGCWHSYPMKLGTAVAVIPCGKGRIVVSTLDICGNVGSPDAAANVARKLLCNFIEFAAGKP
jgi:hypothetical protein